MELIITTLHFILEFAQKEIKTLTKITSNILNESTLSLKISSLNDLETVFYNLFYYSRTIENIYLVSQKYDDIDLPKQNLNFGKKKYEVYDLTQFNLTKRDYKVNTNTDSLNPLIINYCLYLLGIDKKRTKFSVIDPIANLGDIILESSIFNPRIALNVKKRHLSPFYQEFKSLSLPAPPKPPKSSSLFHAIVNDNQHFKLLKENLSMLNQKIRVSKYDIDWLDAKFQKADFDYILSYLPMFKDNQEFKDFQKEFFYQCEFICKKQICVITRIKLDLSQVKKNKLNLIDEKLIELENIKYYIYIIAKK